MVTAIFRPWQRREFSGSERTASNYMELARNFKGKTAKFADLDLGTAMALIAKSTPAEIRDELFEAADQSGNVAREEVRRRIADGKAAARMPRPQQKKAAPSDEKEIETPPAAGKSPAEEVAVAMLSLLQALEKNGLHCKPDDVAELLLERENKGLPPTVSKCAVFLNDVATGLAVLTPPEPEVVSELRALAS